MEPRKNVSMTTYDVNNETYCSYIYNILELAMPSLLLVQDTSLCGTEKNKQKIVNLLVRNGICKPYSIVNFIVEGVNVEDLTPKRPNCVFWQHRNFGQLTTDEVFIFFFEIFAQHFPQGVSLRTNNFHNY